MSVATSNDPWGAGPGITASDYMGCPAGSQYVYQTTPSETGNVAGWHGKDVQYSDGVFTLKDGTTIQDGIATSPDGRVWDTGTGKTLEEANN